MKTNFKKIGLLALATIVFSSCTNNDDTTPTPATAAAFKGIKENGLKKNTQSFTATAGAGVITLTSAKGVVIILNGNDLTKNGSPVTGVIDITFVELFDKGNMLISNKPTMGVMTDGKKSLLKSGGEFFIKASQGGVDLVTTSSIQLKVPANLTGGVDPLMTLWTGAIDTNDNLAWNEVAGTAGGKGGVGAQAGIYFVTFGSFGWTNVDRFYSDPRPKTTILVGAPAGYNNTNSAVFLSYDGEGSALANLDTYTAAGLFSEHYGQVPVGLACHIIFVSEDNGQWKYAIKAATVTAAAVYNFTLAETTTGTEAQVIAAINAL
jgi:hypothetical protein